MTKKKPTNKPDKISKTKTGNVIQLFKTKDPDDKKGISIETLGYISIHNQIFHFGMAKDGFYKLGVECEGCNDIHLMELADFHIKMHSNDFTPTEFISSSLPLIERLLYD